MTEIALADAIAGLVTETRALGYKYVSEERALTRFLAFCASEFPGLDMVTQASVEAWIAAARGRAVTPATVISSAPYCKRGDSRANARSRASSSVAGEKKVTSLLTLGPP